MKKAKKILIVTIITCIVLLVGYTLAKYISESNGQIDATVAQFNFKLTEGTIQESGDILFAITRNDENTKVEDKMLAPGTSGEFKIGIDATRKSNFFRI